MVRIRSKKTQELLQKSREAAILAVDTYNKPATQFRSCGYIVLMNIAWTSLFHAIFEKKKLVYYYKDTVIDGEYKSWDLSKCAKKYFQDNNSPIRKNLEFFVGLRNKIEHRFIPILDLDILGECQALLMNYEKLIVEIFGEDYSLNNALSIPLQLLKVNPTWKTKVLKEIQSEHYQVVKNYIDAYRASLSNEIFNDLEFSFRIFLIPKTGNKESSSDLAVEFVRFDPANPEEMEKYEKAVALIKEKKIHIPVVNAGMLRASDVCLKVSSAIGKRINPSTDHVKCYKHFKIRPLNKDPNPEITDSKYCVYDVMYKTYLYKEDWVNHLISELSDSEKCILILGREPAILDT